MERVPSLRSITQEHMPSLRSLQQPRRNSFSSVSVRLKPNDLIDLLARLACHCHGDDLVYCDQLRSSLRQENGLESLDLEEVSCFLEDLLGTSSNIPSELAVDIHSCIGLIQDRMGLVERAIRSLLRALWIQQKLTADQITTAITEHRLGLVYAKAGGYREAVHLLENALVAYEEARMKPGHSCILEAKEALKDFRVKQLKKELKLRTPGSIHLTDILEEEPITAYI